jgi:hypothetical protein
MDNWTDISKIDVIDKEEFAHYRFNLKKWKEIFRGDDLYSIQNQINDIIFKYSVFKCYGESLRISIPEFTEPVGYQNSLLEVFQTAFMESHIMALRRIIDSNDYNPDRKVYSINRLIDELIDSQKMLKREYYICYDGTGFKKQENEQWQIEHTRAYRNRIFNTMSKYGTEEPDDRIETSVLFGLKKKLNKLEKLRYYSNKYYAHASDPENRSQNEEKNRISLAEIEEYNDIVIDVCIGVGKVIDEIVLAELPTVTFDIFENWNRPVLVIEKKEDLHSFWCSIGDSLGKKSREKQDEKYKNWE